MTDISVAVAEPEAEHKPNIVPISVTKGGGTIEINFDTMPLEVYQACLELGAKELLNRGMSKITVKGLTGADLDKARAAAMAKGQENAAAIADGSVKLPGRKAAAGAKVPKALQAEARRLARIDVKDALRAAGKKISHYTAKAITEAADALIAQPGSHYLKTAEANLAGRSGPAPAIDISAIKEDAKLVEKATKKTKVDDGTLSAKQAGMVKPKAKPTQAAMH